MLVASVPNKLANSFGAGITLKPSNPLSPNVMDGEFHFLTGFAGLAAYPQFI